MAATSRVCAAALVLITGAAGAKVLPEDRADILWHAYDGGGVTVQGPSVLVRKAYKDKVSVWGNYYVDMISGASIDVKATASKYAEKRKETSIGADYLYNKTLMGLGYTRSRESDYQADTARFNLSQDFFGDLTTLTMGYQYGSDTVRRNRDTSFEDFAHHRSYQLGVSQVVNKHMVMNLDYEAVVDDGFLNNPYRSVRFADPDAAKGYSYQPERYPRTHASDAAAIRAMYYLPYRAALRGEYRYYTDSWGVAGQTVEVSYTQPLGHRWELDAKARYYRQGHADFYSDLFPYRDAANFLARDKELATFSSKSIGLGISFKFGQEGFLVFRRGSANLYADYMMFNYDDFSNVTLGEPVGQEPLYNFNALAMRFFVSFWF